MDKPRYHVITNEPNKHQKLNEQKNEKTVNTCTYTLENEDDTMGNLLMETLLDNPRVYFVTYEKKRELENNITLTIRTDRENYTPRDAFEDALKKIIEKCIEIQSEFCNACST